VAASDPTPLSDVFTRDCPGRAVLNHITGRWGMLVLAALRGGPLRFYLLRDRIGGITEKMLSQNLRTLVRDGLVVREVRPTSPPEVFYRLTSLGEGLAEHLQALVDWIDARTPEVVTAQMRYDAATGGSA
jgi:DNA-binding HxlR family transcriptional regulator